MIYGTGSVDDGYWRLYVALQNLRGIVMVFFYKFFLKQSLAFVCRLTLEEFTLGFPPPSSPQPL